MWLCGLHNQYIACEEDLDCMTHVSVIEIKWEDWFILKWFQLLMYGQWLTLLIRKY